MKLSRLSLTLIGVSLASIAVFSQLWAQTTAPPADAPTAKVAVCDVGDVFNKYQRKTDLTAVFNERGKKVEEEDKKRADKLQELEKALESIAPGSKEMDYRFQEIQKLRIERKVWQQVQEETFTREHRLLTEAMYRDMLAGIEALAKERGFDIVLYKETVDISSGSTQELLGKILQRKCLYAAPNLDITASVIERLNKAYKDAQPK